MLLMIFTWLLLAFSSLIYAAEPIQKKPYKVEIKGFEEQVLDGDLINTIEGASNLFLLIDQPPSSSVSLIRRAATDKARTLEVLKSFGYYAGKVAIFIEEIPLTQLQPSLIREVDKPKIVIKVMPGSLYTFNDINLLGLETLDFDLTTILPNFKKGEMAKGSYVLEAEGLILAKLGLEGYPYAKIEKRNLVVDHNQKTMNVTLRFTPGVRAELGQLTIKGLDQVEDDFVRQRITWQLGDRHNPQILESFRKGLTNLGLFSSLKLNIPDAAKLSDDDLKKPLPIELLVEERSRKFIGFGTDYSTTKGLGIGAHWGHRNLFGRGEKLKISTRLDNIDGTPFERTNSSLEMEFSKPDFLTRQQNLLVNSKLVDEYFDGYDRQAISAAIGVKRRLTKQLSLSGGVSGEYSITRQSTGKEENFLIGFPMAVKLDTTNDLLNAETGFRSAVSITPYLVPKGDAENFIVGRFDNSAYAKVTDSGNVVLAGRFAIGSIYGKALGSIPTDKKFYSGGGGSIRGYAYQNVGPLDTEGDPLGGLSFIEVGGEIRYRYQDYGIVPFVDGGNVFASKRPKFSETFQWAAGIGLRYYSAIGPLRIDLAFPVNKREDDDSVAFYLSIGQAF